MTPDVVSALFGIIITELQGGTAYTMMQVHLHGDVVGDKMIWFNTFDVTGGVHQAIGRICGDGHNATEIVHEKAISIPLAGVAPGLEGIACCLEVTLCVLDEIVDLAGAIEAGIDSVNHESHVNVDNLLVPAVHQEYQENHGSPAKFRRPLRLWGHECTLSKKGA